MKARTFKKNPWTREEDTKLTNYINRYKIWNWNQMSKYAGLSRSGKSCRLRWLNYLSPDIKRGNFTKEEDETIINMHQIMGTRWSVIASKLPGRTDNEIKNRWHTHLKKRSRCSINQIWEESPNSSLSKSESGEDDSSIEVNDTKNSCTPQGSLSETCDDVPIFSPKCDILGDFSSLNTDLEVDKAEGCNNKMDVVEPINGDPYLSFWREPYSFGNFCVEDQDQCDIAGAFSDQAAFKPQGSVEEYYSNYDHYDWLNLIGSIGDSQDFF